MNLSEMFGSGIILFMESGKGTEMNEFEAASFYGDYSLLMQEYAEMLSENVNAVVVAWKFKLETTELTLYNRFIRWRKR